MLEDGATVVSSTRAKKSPELDFNVTFSKSMEKFGEIISQVMVPTNSSSSGELQQSNRAVSTHIDDACHGTDEIDEMGRAFDLVRKMEKRKKEMVDEYEDDDSDDDRRESKHKKLRILENAIKKAWNRLDGDFNDKA